MIRKTIFGIIALVLALMGIYLITPQTAIEFYQQDEGYLDAHVHIAGIGAGGSGNFIHPNLRDSYKFHFYLKAFDVTREELETHGDELVVKRLNTSLKQSKYVDKAIILAMDGVIKDDQIDKDATQIYVPNDYAAEMAKRYKHLEYGASVNPDRSDWRDRLISAKRQGALLVKWLPSIMNIDPSNEKYRPYYETLIEMNLPLLVHVGKERSFAHANDSLSDPRKLELPLTLGVTVIAAHIATTGEYQGESSFERILPMFQEFPNLYTDVSSLTQINKLGYLARALKIPGLLERMIYGSDWPLQFFPLVYSFYHWPDIDLPTAKSIQKISNKWDRDIALKQAIGVPSSVFNRSTELLLKK